MRRGPTGIYETAEIAGEKISAFLPRALPPQPPESLNIAREMTGQRRNRIFAYQDYLNLLNEGTETL